MNGASYVELTRELREQARAQYEERLKAIETVEEMLGVRAAGAVAEVPKPSVSVIEKPKPNRRGRPPKASASAVPAATAANAPAPASVSEKKDERRADGGVIGRMDPSGASRRILGRLKEGALSRQGILAALGIAKGDSSGEARIDMALTTLRRIGAIEKDGEGREKLTDYAVRALAAL